MVSASILGSRRGPDFRSMAAGGSFLLGSAWIRTGGYSSGSYVVVAYCTLFEVPLEPLGSCGD